MKNEELEKLVGKVFGDIRSFISSFTQKQTPTIETKLDALLIEKAAAEGIEIKLKKPTNWVQLAAAFFGISLLGTVMAVTVMFVPGPWTRLFAKPQIVSMALSNVDFTFNGVTASSKQVTINSPKAVKSAQFVQASLVIEPDVPVSITLADDNKQIIVVPQEELAKGTNYKVTIKPGLLFTDGTYLANEQSWVIPTKAVFDVVSLSPRDGVQAPRNATFEVSFSTDEFELSEAIKNITILPIIEGNFKKDASRVIFVPTKFLQSGGVYTIKVSKEMKDTEGTKISKDFVSTFAAVKEVDGKTVPASITMKQTIMNIAGNPMQLLMTGTNVKKVSVAIFAVNATEAKPYIDSYMVNGVFNPEPLLQGKKAVSTAAYSGVKVEDSQDYEYALGFSKLAEGIYIVKTSDSSNAQIRQYAVIFKSSLGIYTVKRASRTGVDAWAFSYNSLAPEKEVEITAVGCNDQAVCPSVSSKTPDNGYAQVNTDSPITYVIATKGAGAAIVYPGNQYGEPYSYSQNVAYDYSLLAKIEVNKPVFTPGSVAKYSVILRQKKDGEYKKLPEGQVFTVALCPYTSYDGYSGYASNTTLTARCISVKELKTSGESQLEDTTVLWNRREDLQLLVMQTIKGKEVIVASENLQVMEVDKPQVTIDIASDKAHYVGDAPIKVSGRLTNYVGAGIANKEVRVSFSFNGGSDDNFSIDDIAVRTNAEGNYAVELPAPLSKASSYAYSVWASVSTDDGDNTISDSTRIEWDRGDNVIYTVFNDEKEASSLPVDKTPKVKLNFFDTLTNKGIANKKLSVKVSRTYSVEISGTEAIYDEETGRTYIPTYYEQHVEDIFTREITTDSSGNYTLDIPAVKEGQYHITFIDEANDKKWKVYASDYLFYVVTESLGDYEKINDWMINLSFDREIANVGDKAVLSIDSSFKKNKQQIAFIVKTTEMTEWRYIEQSTETIDFPITKQMVGGVQVCVVHPMKAYEPKEGSLVGTYLGNGINALCTYLRVENKDQKLTIDAKPEAAAVLPGKESNLSIAVKNAQGKGERSVVGVSVVNKALYDATSEEVESRYPDLYKEIYESFSTLSDNGSSSIDVYALLDFYGGMGGAGDYAEPLRKDFDDNPFWKSQVATDGNGSVTIPVQYSDAITSWVVTVWAVTDDLKVGTTVVEVATKKDVYIDFDKPAVIRKNDKWLPYVRVTNATEQPFAGTMEISCDGCLDAPVTYPVSLKAKETEDKQITLTMKKEGSVPITMKLTQNGNVVDQVQYTIEVKPIGFEIPFQQSGTVSKSNTKVTLQVANTVSTELSTFSLTLSQMPLVSGGYLRVDPAFATTPELAGALAAVSTLAEQKAFGTAFYTKEESLQKAQFYVTELLQRMQPNGAFSFDIYTGISYDASIQSAYALALAKSGFGSELPIDANVLVLVAEYQKSLILSDKVTMPVKAQAAYVLAMLQKGEAASLVTALYKVTDMKKATVGQLSYTSLALYEIGASADAGTLVQYIDDITVDAGSLAYVPGTDPDIATAAQAFLINKLGLQSAYKERLKGLQGWVLGSCLQCKSIYSEAVATRLLTMSLLSDQQGSAKAEEVTIIINGQDAGKPFYDGMRLVMQLPEAKFKKGENTIEVKSASGKLLFASINGTFYNTTLESKGGSVYTVQTAVRGLDASRRINAGASNFVEVTITAVIDTLPSTVNLYLPSGFRGKYWLDDNSAFDALVANGKGYVAYGDHTRSDAYSASIPALTKGQKITVLLPFTAVRQGVFSGEIVQVAIANDFEYGTVTQGGTITVR
jgi:hypothetical protein